MTEDEHREDDAEGDPDGDANELPPPATWAGRSRQESADTEPDEGSGMTEEFEGLEAELSASIGSEEDAPDPADEQPDPPDEFEFEEDEIEDDSDAELEVIPDGEPQANKTVEANTVALSDAEAAKEAAKEAAHAGLAARAVKSAASRGVTTGTHAVAPVAAKVAATAGGGNGAGEPPKRRLWWRFAAASLVILASVATATSVTFLLFLSDFAKGLNDESLSAARAALDSVEGGDPQTILVLGSDKRSGTPGDPGRSDTALLMRVDPDKNFLSVMSLPRDLQVPIPGYGVDKLNAAYSFGEMAKKGGGPELAIKTIKEYMGLDINHVVNVDFEGFYEAVNAIDCVYIDVDREYFHSNEGLNPADFYAEIDVPAGYSKLCGFRALEYVRYRHDDNDLVRGTRQQDFIREARQRIPPSELLPVFGGDELIDIFKKNTSSDINNVTTIIEMLKTFVEVRSAPVRQVSIGTITEDGNVAASKSQIETAVDQFLGNDLDDAPTDDAAPSKPKKKPKKPKSGDGGSGSGPELVDSTATAQQYATTFERKAEKRKAKLPIYYPTQIVAGQAAGVSPDSRFAPLLGPEDKEVFYTYKFVLPYQEDFGLSYYGVSGVNWTDPPILKNPSETRTIDGRDYMLFFERDRLRLVGWKTKRASYWVINTLTRTLAEDEMLGVAASTRKLGQ
ncbi:hypothetical protein BH24ACT23_BH24ACT23_00880 [soil metagenome]